MCVLRSVSVTGDQQPRVRVIRDDGGEDAFTRTCYSTYEEAYDELERFYAGLCCSDDRVEYSIQVFDKSNARD